MSQPTFSERSWSVRKNGDKSFFYYSEGKFEQHWPGPYSHFGLGEQTEDMSTYMLSPFLSHAPDYIAAFAPDTKPFLVEVQGTGAGGADADGVVTHKFKIKKLEQLAKWNSTDEVVFWLWNDADQTFCYTSYASIRGMIGRGLATQDSFDGKRPYWAIPVQDIIDNADTERIDSKYA